MKTRLSTSLGTVSLQSSLPPLSSVSTLLRNVVGRALADPLDFVAVVALALAMSRDGSSGGCIRMCVIKKEGVRRIFVPGNELPR